MATIDNVFMNTLADGRTALSGNTFKYKDQIKAAGGLWVPVAKSWTVPAGADLSFIQAPLTVPRPQPNPREEWTKEEWDTYAISYRRLHRGQLDRCCKNAKTFTQYDQQGPICYDCERHGKSYNDYCGD